MHEAPRWEDLRYFAAFASPRSLSAAAASLGVDHVTVGRRIRALETALGVKLLDRRARVPTLSPEGARVAELVGDVTDAADRVFRATRRLRPAIAGDVSISAPPALTNVLLAPRLAELRAKHPALRVVLLGEKRFASLAKGEADVAVRLVRPTQAALLVRKIGTIAFRLYASRTYASSRTPSSYEIVSTHGDESLPQHVWIKKVAPSWPIVVKTNDLESQLAAARGGAGVAVLPDFMAAPHEDLTCVLPRLRPLTRDVWLTVHAEVRASPVVRAAMDFVVAALSGLAR